MPQVPTFNPENVTALQPLRPAYQNPASSDAPFGSIRGRQMSALGAASGRALDQFDAVIDVITEREDEDAARRALVSYNDRMRQLLHEPDKGALNQNGFNARGLAGKVDTAVTQLHGEVSGQLSSPRQRRMFERMSQSVRAGALDRVHTHEAAQLEVSELEGLKALLDGAVDDALTAGSNIDVIRDVLGRSRGAMAAVAARQGWSDAQLDQRMEEHEASVHAAVFKAAMFEKNHAFARGYFNANKAGFDGATQREAAAQLKSAASAAAFSAKVNAMLTSIVKRNASGDKSQHVNEAAALREAREQYGYGKDADRIVNALKGHFSEQNHIERAAREDMNKTLGAEVFKRLELARNARASGNPLPPGSFALEDLAGDANLSLLTLEQRMHWESVLNGVTAPVHDAQLEASLHAQAASRNADVRLQFVQMDLWDINVRSRLSTEAHAKLVKEQNTMRDDPTATSVGILEDQKIMSVVKEIVGTRTDMLQGVKPARVDETVQPIFAAVFAKVEAYRKRMQAVPTDPELRQFVVEAITEGRIRTEGLMGLNYAAGREFQAAGVRGGTFILKAWRDMQEDTRELVKDAMAAAGAPFSVQAAEDFYTHDMSRKVLR